MCVCVSNMPSMCVNTVCVCVCVSMLAGSGRCPGDAAEDGAPWGLWLRQRQRRWRRGVDGGPAQVLRQGSAVRIASVSREGPL